MKTIKQFSVYILLFFLATGCIEHFGIKGNGTEASEERAVANFNKVKSSGSFDVQIVKGDEVQVIITAETNILPHIETSVSNNTLLIDIPGFQNVNNRLPMNVYITIPELVSVKQSGSGDIITTDHFKSENLELFVSGSGSIFTKTEAEKVDAGVSGSGWIMMEGMAAQTYLSISGSGNINSSDLMVQTCNAHISGSGTMQVNAEQSIFARISGSGNIYYHGNPRVETSISGSGKVMPTR